jgi:serine/threonine-protein kinase
LHFLVLEYVDGPSAQELLERFGRLFVADAVHIILDIARGLEHAHSRNLIHRDIKPGNILLTQSGMAKLADLGLAKRTDEASHLTHTRQGFGTPYYMPYEQALNAKYADARSDLYALGATFYHFLVGEVPFQGANSLEIVDKKNVGIFTPASVLNSDVPAVLDRILEKMMARDPADRYQTASELIVDLERSNLAASVPSFTDPDKALQDPQTRQRLLSPPQPTEHDLRNQPGTPVAPPPAVESLWYLRYHDRHGQLCKAKGTLEQVLQRLRLGTLPAGAEASPKPNGDFRPLAAFPEFAPWLPKAALPDEPAPHHRRRIPRMADSFPWIWWVMPLLIAVAILLLVLVTVWLVGLG